MKRKCEMMFDHAVASKKKLKYSYAKVRRLKRKVQSLKDIVTDYNINLFSELSFSILIVQGVNLSV